MERYVSGVRRIVDANELASIPNQLRCLAVGADPLVYSPESIALERYIALRTRIANQLVPPVPTKRQ
jgi:hypothetical protein